MPVPTNKLIIAVIGATGAQGRAVIDQLLASRADGTASPWKVRALTRDTTHRRALELQQKGVELVQGSFVDVEAIERLFDGAYGAYVNTDSFSMSAGAELEAAFKIWETAQLKHVRHFVWSSLDYAVKIGESRAYDSDHYNTKARFAQFLASQPVARPSSNSPFALSDTGTTSWSILTTGPYMELLHSLIGFYTARADGTFIFPHPMGPAPSPSISPDDIEEFAKGRYPLVALSDVGHFASWIFDHPSESVGRDVGLVSEYASPNEIVNAFTRVTGHKAEAKALSPDEFFALFNGSQIPIAARALPPSSYVHATTDAERKEIARAAVSRGELKSWELNFRQTFAIWRDGLVRRDVPWIQSVRKTVTVEEWMRANGYGSPKSLTGEKAQPLKGGEDGSWGLELVPEQIALL